MPYIMILSDISEGIDMDLASLVCAVISSENLVTKKNTRNGFLSILCENKTRRIT
jgi:hypothetical protein